MRARGGNPDALAADAADADAILVRSATKVTAALMDAAPQVSVSSPAPGPAVDNVSRRRRERTRGILVVNAPGATASASLEHAWALILALSRTIPCRQRE